MIKKILYILSGYRIHFLKLALFAFLLNLVFAVTDPLLTKLLIDKGLINRDFYFFAIASILIVSFGILIRVGFFLYELSSQKLKNELTKNLTLKLFQAYYRVPYVEVNKSDSGYFISRIYDEPSKIALSITSICTGILIQVVIFISSFVVSLYLAWRITLILLIAVPFLYYLSSKFNPKIKKSSKIENEEEAKLREVLGRSIDAYKSVNIFSLYDVVQNKVLAQINAFLDVFYFRVKTTRNFQTLSGICLALAEASVLIAASYEVVKGNLTVGGLFGFMNSFWKLINAANSFISQLSELAKIEGYIDRFIEFENSAKKVNENGHNNQKLIEVENLSFRYDEKPIFEDFNLKIPEKEKVLIVGANGSGKTTLSHIITGLIEPEDGRVSYPGIERMSAMLSPFYFIPGSLKDNIKFELLSDDKKKVFWHLVEKFNIQSLCDKEVSSLSEGEKKKSQIIITLLKDADIYIFDEPLANIDVESKEEILKQQFLFTEGKTLVVIMHGDEQFHKMFDRKIVLEKALVEQT